MVQALVQQGIAHADQVVIQGGSAGGFTVLNALVNSSVFAAGASYYGVADMLSLASDTHDFESRYLDSLLGPLPESRDVYIARSPLTHVSKMSAALILFQGSEDKVAARRFRAVQYLTGVSGCPALPERNHPRCLRCQRPQVQVSVVFSSCFPVTLFACTCCMKARATAS